MMVQLDGLNVHHKFRISIRKPLGSSNSIANRIISKPLPTLVGSAVGLGPVGALIGAGVTDVKADAANKMSEYERKQNELNASAQNQQDELTRLASEEEAKRRALGLQQQGQINAFADQQQQAVADYRKTLAANLSQTAQQTFQQQNPYILEDLNARGLFTSQTARDDAQNRALQELSTQQNNVLSNYDTSQFNNIQDIRGSALSALLGGDQSALDSALDLRKAGIQRQFDLADQQRQQSFAEMLAKRQSRDQLIGSILGMGGQLGGAALMGGMF